MVDPYSWATVPIQLYFENTELSLATAFIWEKDGKPFLITNWHNVTGVDPFSGKHISPTGAEPNRMQVWWNKKGELGRRHGSFIALKDANGAPLWLAHPHHGSKVDVVAIPIAPDENSEMIAINNLPSCDLAVGVGTEVFVLGYPFGIGPAGLPIWKRGSIASEPQLSPLQPHVFVDTASRPGMSGSPIIRRSWGTHELRGGGTITGIGPATAFFGVYSGRFKSSDALDAQLGIAWPKGLLLEILSAQKRAEGVDPSVNGLVEKPQAEL
jgi:hypothetical protein